MWRTYLAHLIDIFTRPSWWLLVFGSLRWFPTFRSKPSSNPEFYLPSGHWGKQYLQHQSSCCSLVFQRDISWPRATERERKGETMWSHTYGTCGIYLCILGCVCIMRMCAWWRAGAVPGWRHNAIQGQVMLEVQAACRVVLLQGESTAALRAPTRWSSEAWCFRITDICWHRMHWKIHLLSSKPNQHKKTHTKTNYTLPSQITDLRFFLYLTAQSAAYQHLCKCPVD